ncbi:NAD(P)H-dependent oxidoreductase [Treponema primitia]|uniref:flavodoxin n=1 Tax=Treponema primitia TaxID=88058 RepID=UPI00398045ED
MKKLFLIITFFCMGAIMQANAQNQSSNGKILVAYFSWGGTTRSLAEQIHGKTGGDLFEIKTVTAYSSNYNTVLDQAQNEKRQNSRPPLATHVENIAQYDIVFIGFPNWWADMPMAVYSFLEEYDFSGKRIVPFCTHGGSGFSGTIRTLRNKLTNSTLLEGFDVSGKASQSNVDRWLRKIGVIN